MTDVAPALSVEGTFDLADGNRLFHNLNLTVAAGEWTCLLGPSGVGKSTLLRILAGLSTGGTFDGQMSASDGQPIQSRIAYMAQTDLIAPWLNVSDAISFGARLRGEEPDQARANALIKQVGLAEHRHKRRKELSGGMRQRVALARTLMEDRPIALLDEPFSALDARTRADMQELAFQSLRGRTVLLVTHDPLEAARLGSQIYLMRGQNLEQMNTPDAQPIRPADDPSTMAVQSELLRTLRGLEH